MDISENSVAINPAEGTLYVVDVVISGLPVVCISDEFLRDFINILVTNDEHSVFADHLERLCMWLRDCSLGTIVNQRNYDKSYLGFELINQSQLDNLCYLANKYFLSSGRIDNSAGEIVPGKDPLKIKTIEIKPTDLH